MTAPCVRFDLGSRWVFEALVSWGFLVGFSVLVNPTPGLALNLGPFTVLLWRDNYRPQHPLCIMAHCYEVAADWKSGLCAWHQKHNCPHGRQ
jgi:hypothetical protein